MELPPPLHLGVVTIEKGAFGSPLSKVANFTYLRSGYVLFDFWTATDWDGRYGIFKRTNIWQKNWEKLFWTHVGIFRYFFLFLFEETLDLETATCLKSPRSLLNCSFESVYGFKQYHDELELLNGEDRKAGVPLVFLY